MRSTNNILVECKFVLQKWKIFFEAKDRSDSYVFFYDSVF